MMRAVLYLHETGDVSGAENSLLGLVSGLDKARYKAVAACPPEGGFTKALVLAGAKTYSVRFPSVRRIKGVMTVVGILRNIIQEEHISLLHSNSIRTHIYAMLACRAGKIPVVWHERNLVDGTKEIVDLDRMLSFLPEAIIANSNAVAARFKKGGKIVDKVRVIHNGVDTARFSPAVSGEDMRRKLGAGPAEVVIGIASRFNKIKGHEVLFAAVAGLLKKMPDERERLRVLVVGSSVFNEDKDREESLKELVRKLKIEDRVIFTGQIDNMPEAYASMDIFALPSLTEACSRSVIEAMAMGRPVIGSRSGGNPELIIDGVTGLLVPPGDAIALAGALESMIASPERRRMLGVAARKRAEESFGVEANVLRTEALYDELLED